MQELTMCAFMPSFCSAGKGTQDFLGSPRQTLSQLNYNATNILFLKILICYIYFGTNKFEHVRTSIAIC